MVKLSPSEREELQFILWNYNRRRYSKCIELLHRYLYNRLYVGKVLSLLSVSYLLSGSFKEGQEYSAKAMEHDPYDAFALLCKAYIDLKEGKKSRSVYLYTRLINLNKEKRLCKKILNLLKKNDSLDKIVLKYPARFFLPSKITMRYWDETPASPRSAYFIRLGFWSGIPLLVILLLFYSREFFPSQKKEPQKETKQSLGPEGINAVNLFEEKKDHLSQEEQKWEEEFELIRKNILNRQVNEAQIRYNSIRQNGKISQEVKNKFGAIMRFNLLPDFVNFQNTQNLETTISDDKYLDTYVKLIGILTFDEKISKEKNRYVVAYLSEIQGESYIKSVPILFESSTLMTLENRKKYEILVKYRGFEESSGNIRLEEVALKQLP